MTESLDIELDIEECVPTVRINPDAYRAMVNEQEHARTPITQRYAIHKAKQ